MRGLYRSLLVLTVPTVTLLLRVPFLMGGEGLYGFDPYVHLYIVKLWLRQGGWTLAEGGGDVIDHDYHAWPGVHVTAASTSSFGLEPIDVLDWTPLVLLFFLDLAVVLVLARRTDLRIAAVGGVLFGLADYMFLQTMWFTPEAFGLLLIAALLLNELSVGSRVLSVLLLTGLLLVHHLSFLIGVMFWLVLQRSRLDRALLLSVALVSAEVVLFWGLVGPFTGSFPDIQNQLGGVPPALIVVAAMVAVVVAKRALVGPYERLVGAAGPDGEARGGTDVVTDAGGGYGGPGGDGEPDGGGGSGGAGPSLLELIGARFGRPGHVATLAGIAAVVAATLAIYYSSLVRFDGIGVQPSKLLVLAGAVLFLVYAPAGRREVKVLAAFALVLLLFTLNPVLYDFLPLEVRFLDFLYLPGFVILALGAHGLSVRRPGRAGAVLLALLLVAPALVADDALRHTSDSSLRFQFHQGDLDFARSVGERTEEGAVVVAPFNLASVVIGVSERRSRSYPVRVALDEGGYVEAVPYLEEIAEERPCYLVHSSERLLYLGSEHDEVSDGDLARLEASLDDIQDRLELVLESGGHRLYRFR
jgi:hypothetical protein